MNVLIQSSHLSTFALAPRAFCPAMGTVQSRQMANRAAATALNISRNVKETSIMLQRVFHRHFRNNTQLTLFWYICSRFSAKAPQVGRRLHCHQEPEGKTLISARVQIRPNKLVLRPKNRNGGPKQGFLRTKQVMYNRCHAKAPK